MSHVRVAPKVRSAFKICRTLARPAVQAVREIPVHSARLWQKGRGPHALFLPAYGPSGAALLRIYLLARALRAKGWITTVLPPTLGLGQRQRILRSTRPDIVVMQGARHALNRPEFYRDVPIFYDLDDADFHLAHLEGPVRRAMGGIAGVIAGSTYIADWCRRAGAAQTHVVWTGAPPSTRVWPAQQDRPPVIAWSQTRPMTYVHEAALVRSTVAQIGAARPVTLRLYDRQPGDDPAFAHSFKAPGVSVEWRETSRYSDYLQSFGDVALGLAPLCPDAPFARGKSFGKVLAYFDARVPVIGSEACEHGAFFDGKTGVITNDRTQWVKAGQDLLENALARQTMADAAYLRFQQTLTTSAAAHRLDDILSTYLQQSSRAAV